MLYGNNEQDIVGQYVLFTKVLDEQIKKYGRTREAVQAAIDICKDKNILKSYLERHEQEVRTIMMDLFDQETVFKVYAKNIEAKVEARGEAIGEARGEANKLWELVNGGLIDYKEAWTRSGLSEQEFLKYKPEAEK